MSGAHGSLIDPRLLAIVWVAVCAVYVAFGMAGGGEPLITDSDDALRLTLVRDLIEGAGWYDHVLDRLNTPHGAFVHWSRLIDLPLAGLTLVLTPFAGDSALYWTARIWPLLLLLAAMALSASLTVKLVGRAGLLPALVLPALSAPVISEFAPGRVDHHNVQIVLALAMLWGTVFALDRPRFAVAAGLAAATSLAIGLESLPIIMAATAAFGIAWVANPAHGRTFTMFGTSFGAAAVGQLMLARSPDAWLTPACDMISPPFVGAALGVALIAATLPVLVRGGVLVRLMTGAGTGAVLVALLVLVFPQCLGGPYAGMDPWLAENWLPGIVEAKPVWQAVAGRTAFVLGAMVPPLVAAGVTLYRIATTWKAERHIWIVLGIFLFAGLAVTLFQIRGARLAAPMAVPAAAWLIAMARDRFVGTRHPADAARLVGAWLISAGLAIMIGAGLIVSRVPEGTPTGPGGQAQLACLAPGAFENLAPLPPERVMTPVDLGAHMLLYTPHAVVAAPYHRNEQGVLDAFTFFAAPAPQARDILNARGIGLVVTCPGMAAVTDRGAVPDDAMINRLASGDLPGWLEDMSLPGSALGVYAVLE